MRISCKVESWAILSRALQSQRQNVKRGALRTNGKSHAIGLYVEKGKFFMYYIDIEPRAIRRGGELEPLLPWLRHCSQPLPSPYLSYTLFTHERTLTNTFTVYTNSSQWSESLYGVIKAINSCQLHLSLRCRWEYGVTWISHHCTSHNHYCTPVYPPSTSPWDYHHHARLYPRVYTILRRGGVY